MNIEHRTSNVERPTRASWAARAVLGVFAAGMIFSVSTGAEQTNTYPPIDSFKIIRTRNIFDPNRTGRQRPDNTGQRQRRPTIDAFSLVGTMSYTKGRFAFFDGSASQYKKVIEPGGVIAGYTVKEITPDNVTLSANGKEFAMAVGAQMRNQGENKWVLAGHTEPVTEETNDDTAAVESSAPPAGASPEMNDVLKQMMLRRQQELK